MVRSAAAANNLNPFGLCERFIPPTMRMQLFEATVTPKREGSAHDTLGERRRAGLYKKPHERTTPFASLNFIVLGRTPNNANQTWVFVVKEEIN